MKKVLLLIISLIVLFVFNIKSYAYIGNGFVWSRSDLYVDVNTSFESYISQIEVKFYYNGSLTNEEVKVELDRFYYGSNTIETDVVGDKNVMLYAYVPGYTNYSRKNILVHIIDNEYPVIKCIKELVWGPKDDINLSDYFMVSDNDKIKEGTLKFSKNDDEIHNVGEHEITVSVSDVSGNMTSKIFKYSVVDTNSPVLTLSSNIEIEYGDYNFDLKDFVYAYDLEDGELTNAVTYTDFDPYKLGEQEIIFSVKDSAGHLTEVKKTISVVDLTAPILELSTYSDTYYIEDIEELDLRKYVSKVYDNVDDLSFSDVIVDTADLSKAIGTYKVAFTLFDNANNYTKRYLTLQIRYKEGPVIEAEDFSIEVGDNIDWSKYVNVYSAYDQNVANNYIIDSKILDTNQIGTYEVIIEALDYAGNESSKSIMVTVKNDSSSATLEKASDFYSFIYNYKILIIIGIVIGFAYLAFFLYKRNKKLGV